MEAIRALSAIAPTPEATILGLATGVCLPPIARGYRNEHAVTGHPREVRTGRFNVEQGVTTLRGAMRFNINNDKTVTLRALALTMSDRFQTGMGLESFLASSLRKQLGLSPQTKISVRQSSQIPTHGSRMAMLGGAKVDVAGFGKDLALSYSIAKDDNAHRLLSLSTD